MKKTLSSLLSLLLLTVLLFTGIDFALPQAQAEGFAQSPAQSMMLTAKSKKKKTTPTPEAAAKATPKPTKAPTQAPAKPTPTPVPSGPIIEPQAIADYIFANGRLPDNFITKKQAQDLGWDSYRNYVSDVAPGKSIGGDRFGNYEEILPVVKGRKYFECDCYYTKGKRNAYRIIFSNDGHVWYTADHYQTFTEMHPSTP